MRGAFLLGAIVAVAASSSAYADPGQCTAHKRFAVVVHGGELSQRFDDNGRLAVMKDALTTARAALANGASSIDVVEAIVSTFEDSGLFNSGKGAIANKDGMVETDASIMDGNGLRAGAVASMTGIKNPVRAARLVMDKSPHVLMVGDRGEAFVKSIGAESAPPGYFRNNTHPYAGNEEHGTVGAVALDRCGHIAAATSTGGYDAKIPGRVGDSPIVGAGVYADDNVAGFSATGHGEYFIRFSIAKDVADRMRYGHQAMVNSMASDLEVMLAQYKDGDGALIGIDAQGNVVTMWNSVGLFRGFATDREAPVVAEYQGPSASAPRR
ncbi:MAG TPA: isoaspartyl peptidase/L-asparaginase [Rhizomicrobium sp.]|jgi:beta-aspartyl-peptidase (threonine type)|nr:isoaspartyl peptidase/L-asparaginase [Rhizomicrobium sp.]